MSWTIHGDPKPHPRPQLQMRGKLRPHVFQPKTDWQKFVTAVLKTLDLPHYPSPQTVRVIMAFMLPRPKTHYRTGRYSHLLKPTSLEAPVAGRSVGDTDNYAKSILDAMNGQVYDDDKQVTELRVSKRYAEWGEKPGVTFSVGRAA